LSQLAESTWKRLISKRWRANYDNLYFAGEIVNIDAITGDLISKMPGQAAYTS
jgi:hypothetical protein